MDNNPEDEASYTTQYQQAVLKYVENEYCAKHRRMSILKPENVPPGIIFPSAQASGFGQSSIDPYYLSSDDENDVTPNSVAERHPDEVITLHA